MMGVSRLGASTFLALCGVLLVACTGTDGSVDLDAPVIPIAEDLRIDGYAADLVPVNWLGANESGTIAVLQWQDHSVRFFDGAGKFERFIAVPAPAVMCLGGSCEGN